VTVLLGSSAIGNYILFQPDQTVYDAALKLKSLNKEPHPLALLISNHAVYAVDHGNLPTFPYYSGIPVWCHHRRRPVSELESILRKVNWIVVLNYTPSMDPLFRDKTFFSKRPPNPHDVSWIETRPDFKRVASTPEYTIYEAHHLP